MHRPIVVRGAGVDRPFVRRVAEAMEASGVGVEVPRFARKREGVWVVTDGVGPIDAGAEAIICLTEDAREAVEAAHPELIGNVWVVPEGSLGTAVPTLVSRYRPAPLGVHRRVGIVGPDLKFISAIERHLRRVPDVEVMVDAWPKYAVNDAESTARVVGWADTIVAEWCGPNAVYASTHKRDDQRLIVRLHRFELERDDWTRVDIDAVDVVVTVGAHYRDLVLARTGWPEAKVTVVPNWVDIAQLDRPKLPGSVATFGLLGAIPWRKRPDRALDLVEQLRRDGVDARLSIKSRRPDTQRWNWDDPEYRSRYAAVDERMARLGDAAHWHPAGPDVPLWLRSVGWVLSPSEDESFHLAPAEGMAAHSIPVVWNWPGADRIYDPRWVVGDTTAAAALIGSLIERDAVTEESLMARTWVERYRLEPILETWALLVGPDPTGAGR